MCHVKVKVAQLCPTLCDPMDYTPHGILQARILEWVAFPFSRGFSQARDQTQVSCIAGGFFTAEPQGSPNVSCRQVQNLNMLIQFVISCWSGFLVVDKTNTKAVALKLALTSDQQEGLLKRRLLSLTPEFVIH